jgi:predicted Co/Zn/Cd cation transporter (cation efflux family)
VNEVDAAIRREQRALKISVGAALFFALLGFGFAILTHSQAILLDGVISLVGLGVSVLTLFVARLVELPGDDTFPFGYAHFEPKSSEFYTPDPDRFTAGGDASFG